MDRAGTCKIKMQNCSILDSRRSQFIDSRSYDVSVTENREEKIISQCAFIYRNSNYTTKLEISADKFCRDIELISSLIARLLSISRRL